MLYKTKIGIENFILFLVGNLISLILLVVIIYLLFRNRDKLKFKRKNNNVPKHINESKVKTNSKIKEDESDTEKD